ncbi:hypothetical protein EDD76_112150 [Kineothrix alysoides]|uniref:Uncharacterized protein n=1 Tax=Kineothrix alysoides TaxID=1469948 RepID=A0A4V2QBG4_9FIRM|nr:hypothetical protein EDD76_112150 [Kineothrix alysoides]
MEVFYALVMQYTVLAREGILFSRGFKDSNVSASQHKT